MTHAVPGHPEAIPGAPTALDAALSGDSPTMPSWLEEPVKHIANVVSALIALLTAISALLLWLTDLVPDKYRVTLAAVVGGIGTAVAVLQKLLAWFTREKVWSPASVATVTRTALAMPPPGTEVIVATANGPVSTGVADELPPTVVLDDDGTER